MEMVDADTVAFTAGTGKEVRFPLEDWAAVREACVKQIRDAGKMRDVEEFDAVVTCLRESRARAVPPGAEDDERLAHVLRNAPKILEVALPFQRAGILRGVGEFNGRVLLGDEMGLGKTIQSIGIVSHFTTERILVICPASLGKHWVRELGRWFTSEVKHIKHDSERVDYDAARVFVVSYYFVGSTARRKYAEIRARRWDAVILDESHALQDPLTQRSKALAFLREQPVLVLISGTPQLARPAQLYVQMSLLFPPNMFERWDWVRFTKRYCAGHMHPYFRHWDATGSSRELELSLLLKTKMIRRLAKDVLKLPPKERAMVPVVVTPEGAAEYRAAVEEGDEAVRRAERALREGTGSEEYLATQHKLRKTALYRATCRAKLSATCEYVVAFVLAQLPRKTIVFAHHKLMRDALVEALERGGAEVVAISGETPTDARQPLVDRVADPDSPTQCAVLSISACAVGLNFTPGVCNVLFAEFSWTPSLHGQAECRAHRIGAVHPVTVKYLVASDTLDEELMEMLVRKSSVTSQCVGDLATPSFEPATTEDTFGLDLAKFGIIKDANRVRVLPTAKEPFEHWLKRAAVPVTREDAEFFSLRDTTDRCEGVYHLNQLNQSGSAAFRNLRELPLEMEEKMVFGVLHIVCSLAPEEIARIQRLPTSYQRAEALARDVALATFAPVSRQRKAAGGIKKAEDEECTT